MKLEDIYNDINNIIKNEMDLKMILQLKEKLEKAIRENTCYKTTSKTRVDAIKRVASKSDVRPALQGYGLFENYKVVTDSYHAIAIYQDAMPLKLVTTDNNLIEKEGKENCIIANYPNFENILKFDTSNYNTIQLDYNDIMSFYKLHKKESKEVLYSIDNYNYNISYLKNLIDVLGTDINVYIPKEDYGPLFIVNKNNEIGLLLPVKTY